MLWFEWFYVILLISWPENKEVLFRFGLTVTTIYCPLFASGQEKGKIEFCLKCVTCVLLFERFVGRADVLVKAHDVEM